MRVLYNEDDEIIVNLYKKEYEKQFDVSETFTDAPYVSGTLTMRSLIDQRPEYLGAVMLRPDDLREFELDLSEEPWSSEAEAKRRSEVLKKCLLYSQTDTARKLTIHQYADATLEYSYTST